MRDIVQIAAAREAQERKLKKRRQTVVNTVI